MNACKTEYLGTNKTRIHVRLPRSDHAIMERFIPGACATRDRRGAAYNKFLIYQADLPRPSFAFAKMEKRMRSDGWAKP